MLNGKVCYLRGASITLHRFFGDPKSGGLPWNEAWVRRLLVDIPRRMNWNAFRICIGPPPQQWLDIADEAGLLLQWEFPIWSDREPLRHKLWKEDEMERRLHDFMRQSSNHPSVFIWDTSNETHWDFLRGKLLWQCAGSTCGSAVGKRLRTARAPRATLTRSPLLLQFTSSASRPISS